MAGRDQLARTPQRRFDAEIIARRTRARRAAAEARMAAVAAECINEQPKNQHDLSSAATSRSAAGADEDGGDPEPSYPSPQGGAEVMDERSEQLSPEVRRQLLEWAERIIPGERDRAEFLRGLK